MSLEEAKANINQLVRIGHNNGRGKSGGGHFMRGKLVGLTYNQRKGVVQIFGGHKGTREIELDALNLWKSKVVAGGRSMAVA